MAVNKKKKQAAQEDDFFEYDDAFTINEEDISGARRRSDRKRGNDAGRGAERGGSGEEHTCVGVQAPRFPIPQLTGLPAGHQTEGNDAAGSRGRRLYVLRLVLVNTRRK